MRKTFFENIRVAGEAIRSHVLRTTLTVLIIATGIMALVGILTAIDSVNYYLRENFATMGVNTFSIKNRELRGRIAGKRIRSNTYYKPITYREAEAFSNTFNFPASVSVSAVGTGIATLRKGSYKTDPNVRVVGGDANYLLSSGVEIGEGRNFTDKEVMSGHYACIIGSDIANKLFPNNENPVGSYIAVGTSRFEVVGVLKKQGSSFGFSQDQMCVIPLNNLRQNFYRSTMSFTVEVTVNNPSQLNAAIGEATGAFRIIRGDQLGEPDSFVINKSDELLKVLKQNTSSIVLAATFIAIITLMGAAIGLMNIMLVSVTERTKEIGIRKAIGANNAMIRNQFLVEAILISQMGGVVGIFLGIVVGNVVSYLIGSAFIIPWVWIIMGFVLCFVVAIVSGIRPAVKASKLDPIESLRYE